MMSLLLSAFVCLFGTWTLALKGATLQFGLGTHVAWALCDYGTAQILAKISKAGSSTLRLSWSGPLRNDGHSLLLSAFVCLFGTWTLALKGATLQFGLGTHVAWALCDYGTAQILAEISKAGSSTLRLSWSVPLRNDGHSLLLSAFVCLFGTWTLALKGATLQFGLGTHDAWALCDYGTAQILAKISKAGSSTLRFSFSWSGPLRNDGHFLLLSAFVCLFGTWTLALKGATLQFGLGTHVAWALWDYGTTQILARTSKAGSSTLRLRCATP